MHRLTLFSSVKSSGQTKPHLKGLHCCWKECKIGYGLLDLSQGRTAPQKGEPERVQHIQAIALPHHGTSAGLLHATRFEARQRKWELGLAPFQVAAIRSKTFFLGFWSTRGTLIWRQGSASMTTKTCRQESSWDHAAGCPGLLSVEVSIPLACCGPPSRGHGITRAPT